MNPYLRVAPVALALAFLALWGCKKSDDSGNPPEGKDAPDFIQHPDTTASTSNHAAVVVETAQEAKFVENPVKFPTQEEMQKSGMLLPEGFEAGVTYNYGALSDAIWKQVERGDEGKWLKTSLKAVKKDDAWQEHQASQDLPGGYWRVVFYPKINQTWMEEIHTIDGHSNMTIIKVARGKRPNLNME